MKGYEDLTGMQIDAIREIASIGAGNAATALSDVLGQKVKITVPKVELLSLDDAADILGGPENIISAIMVRMAGSLNGIVLYMQDIQFINVILGSVLSKSIKSYEELNEMDKSALIEIGNIIISSFTTALSRLADLNISLSVPGHCINMAGAILSVPMTEINFTGKKIMFMDGNFLCGGQETSSNLLLMPDVESLDLLLEKMGVHGE